MHTIALSQGGITTEAADVEMCDIQVGLFASKIEIVELELSGGNDNTAKNLKRCTGECDADSQCAAGLACFQRSYGGKIPGCSGAGAGRDWDYCYDPKPPRRVETTLGNGGNGVTVLETGVGTRIGTSTHCHGSIAASKGNGIEVFAPNTRVESMSIGAGPEGTGQVYGGNLANGGHGVHAHVSATEVAVASCIITGNKGDGVRAEGKIPVLDGNVIGQGESVGDAKSGNEGSGVHLEETAVGARIGFPRECI